MFTTVLMSHMLSSFLECSSGMHLSFDLIVIGYIQVETHLHLLVSKVNLSGMQVVLFCKKIWISFCIWATELESGISSSDTYSSSRLICARNIVLDPFNFEVDNHRAPVEISNQFFLLRNRARIRLIDLKILFNLDYQSRSN